MTISLNALYVLAHIESYITEHSYKLSYGNTLELAGPLTIWPSLLKELDYNMEAINLELCKLSLSIQLPYTAYVFGCLYKGHIVQVNVPFTSRYNLLLMCEPLSFALLHSFPNHMGHFTTKFRKRWKHIRPFALYHSSPARYYHLFAGKQGKRPSYDQTKEFRKKNAKDIESNVSKSVLPKRS